MVNYGISTMHNNTTYQQCTIMHISISSVRVWSRRWKKCACSFTEQLNSQLRLVRRGLLILLLFNSMTHCGFLKNYYLKRLSKTVILCFFVVSMSNPFVSGISNSVFTQLCWLVKHNHKFSPMDTFYRFSA